MDFDLTDEQRLIRESARDFSQAVIAPRARDNNREHKFDTELVAKMAEQGYLGAVIPKEYGGPGLDYLSYGFIVEEVGRACSGMRTVVSVNTSLVASPIIKWGSEEQKHAYLPKIASGEWMGCFGLTEPDTGSDAANQKTRATQREDGTWVINGSKMWISLGNYADFALIFAQTDPSLGYKGLACFFVKTDQDGFQPTPIHGKMGMHAVDTAAISLIDVEAESMLGGIGDGFKVAMSALESGRYSVAAGCVGIAEGCVRESTNYAKEREQFGRPLAAFQLVNAKIADMRVRTDAARMLVWRAAWLKDTGKPNNVETSIAKLFATETAVWAANEAIQIHGGAGYVDDHPVERYFRDSRVTTLYEGTSQIQQLIIGRAETGVNAMVPA